MASEAELLALAERLDATIHMINGHWWNKRKRPEAPDLRAAILVILARAATMGGSDER